jgi:hypothetical protein
VVRQVKTTGAAATRTTPRRELVAEIRVEKRFRADGELGTTTR